MTIPQDVNGEMLARRRKPRPRRALTRERILAEGARVFNRCGYHGTTLNKIARALGVTKAALYYHVRTKEELAFRCHALSLDIGMEGIRLALARGGRPDEQLVIALAHYMELMTDQLRGTVVLLEEGTLSPGHRRHIIRRRDEYEAELRKIIAAGIKAGVFLPCEPKLMGFGILGAMNWLPKWYSPTGPHSGKEIAEALATYLVRGLQRRPSEKPIPPATDGPQPRRSRGHAP